MQTRGKIFDDLARLANSAAGTMTGIRGEIETMVRQKLERMMSDMDLVPREEFDAIRDVAREARLRQEELEKRVAKLEAALTEMGNRSASAPSSTGKKTATRKSAGKASASKPEAKKS